MKLLSEQIRELVQQSTTSSYAIARHAGIDKSAMSRFMNGGKLTMDKLDQLARVLGVIVTTNVSLVPRPPEKGRPKEKTMIIETISRSKAKSLADHLTNDAHENFFPSRRGIWTVDDHGLLFVYNNNPYQISSTLRESEMVRLERSLKKIGIKVLARGVSDTKINAGPIEISVQEGSVNISSPKTSLPYSVGLLLDCSEDRIDEVEAAYLEEVKTSQKEIAAISSRSDK